MDNPSLALIGISAAVLVSYWFMHLGQVLRLPSVVFLLAAGLALRQLTDVRNVTILPGPDLLPLLGTLGLILIVLEGALDLDLKPGRRMFLLRTFLAAGIGVVLTSAAGAAALHLAFDMSIENAALMAIPFGVISSAVAIPSADVMGDDDREFVIYESSWSDILGVMLFNAALVFVATGSGFTLNFFGGGLAILVIGTLIGLGMYWLVGHLEGHVKFVPLLFALILIYGAAKALHLSPLLIVLILGLMLNNPHLIGRVKWFDRLHSPHYHAELDKLKHLTAEATFLARTFFFLLLGYSTDLRSLLDLPTWGMALAMVVAVFVLRWMVLRMVGVRETRPLVWAAPRGLITVLLFYSLPPGMVPEKFRPGALILVVLLSCIVMAGGLRADAKPQARSEAPPPDESDVLDAQSGANGAPAAKA